MRCRSLAGVALLGLSASCVPPMAIGANVPVPPPFAALPASAPVRTGGLFLQATPLYPAPASPAFAEAAAAPFVPAAQSGDDAARARDCLTAAIYYEARSQSVDGQRAVAQVVLNRVRSPAFPGSVCGVVYQGSHLRTGCQFSFTCDGSMLYRRDPAAWERAAQVASDALAGSVYTPVGTATFYHTTAVSPWWAPSLTPVTTIGAHIFYRWPGALGQGGAFRQAYAGIEPGAALAAAGGNGVATMESVMRYTFDGTTIAVFRGNVLAPHTVERAERGVSIHSGDTHGDDPSPTQTSAQADSGSGVTVHHGVLPAELARAARGDLG